MLYKKIISKGLINIEDAYKVREEVFMGEQKISEEIEKDVYDKLAYHCIIYHNEKSIATARLIEKNLIWSIGRVAVIKSYRKKGLGIKLMEYLLEYAKEKKINQVEVHAQKSVELFYGKLKFRRIGDEYFEAGIMHITMIKKI